jgi:hypothetical protein
MRESSHPVVTDINVSTTKSKGTLKLTTITDEPSIRKHRHHLRSAIDHLLDLPGVLKTGVRYDTMENRKELEQLDDAIKTVTAEATYLAAIYKRMIDTITPPDPNWIPKSMKKDFRFLPNFRLTKLKE